MSVRKSTLDSKASRLFSESYICLSFIVSVSVRTALRPSICSTCAALSFLNCANYSCSAFRAELDRLLPSSSTVYLSASNLGRRARHAARDAVDVRNELAAQAHRVVLAISLLLRRSLRGGRERQQRETIEDGKTRDQLQLTLRNPISHGRAPCTFHLYTDSV
jgi:hypothetical protein